MPPELDVEKIVKELTIGEKGYVLISGLFSQEEIDLARYVMEVFLILTILLRSSTSYYYDITNLHRETSLYIIETEGQYVRSKST